jgi:glycosyltransferase involved in cell wall biosynthesis
LASGDSHTAAELVPAVPVNIRAQMSARTAREYVYYEQHQLILALSLAPAFDVIHSHIGPGGYALSGVPQIRGRVLHTQHNPVYRDQEWFVREHPEMWFSTVSEHLGQRLRQQGSTRCRVILNGLDVSKFTFQQRGGRGLLYLGRLEAEKGPDLAVGVARELGWPLMMAGPIIEADYFESAIRPLLDEQIRYVGVVDHGQKNELLGQADCVLMPSRVEEGFGMVSVEAMACGTPVVALGNGALPEIVEQGLTGFWTKDESSLASLVRQALGLDRAAIRARAAARFNLSWIAERYCEFYAEMIDAAETDDARGRRAVIDSAGGTATGANSRGSITCKSS